MAEEKDALNYDVTDNKSSLAYCGNNHKMAKKDVSSSKLFFSV